MEKNIRNTQLYSRLGKLFLGVVAAGCITLTSCQDDYDLDKKEPGWLGSSIYGYLEDAGNFKNLTRLIDDLDYKEVLNQTGSKTLFAASDEAFEEFYRSNEWGVTSYENFTVAQKNLLLNFCLLDNAYLIHMLANYGTSSSSDGLKEGGALRHKSSISVLDSVPFISPENIPDKKYWMNDYRKDKGLYMVEDNTSITLVHFLEKNLANNFVKDNDIEVLLGTSRSTNDAHIFDKKVIERDITCKNGYIHILDGVLIPPRNMSEYINLGTERIFADLLERYSAPFYSSTLTTDYKKIHPEFTDSIFVKTYYNKHENYNQKRYPDGSTVSTDRLLWFDPSWNSYSHYATGSTLYSDMAAIFLPTDNAMNTYLNGTGEGDGLFAGQILKEQYGSWENIPDNIITPLVNRHMHASFFNAIPSKFDKLIDSENTTFDVKIGDIEKAYIGTNGVVYHTSQVYPPDDYKSVYAPILFSDKTNVIRKAILHDDIEFRLYLNSMVSKYSLFVPTDEYFTNYIDPYTMGNGAPGALKFWLTGDDATATTNRELRATVYSYDMETMTLGDSVAVISNNTFLANRLLDILDTHVVVENASTGTLVSNEGYFLTKGGSIVYIEGQGASLTIQGGHDIETGVKVNVLRDDNGQAFVFEQGNGTTYFIDKPIQNPLQSVYGVLSNSTKYENSYDAFFELLNGFDAVADNSTEPTVFLKNNNTKSYGIDYNVKFFNTYNYTVYAPTNEAIEKAIKSGYISPWEDTYYDGVLYPGIHNMAAADASAAKAHLLRFLRYHFQDNAVFVEDKDYSNTCQTATMKIVDEDSYFGTYLNKYYKIGIQSVDDRTYGGKTLQLTMESMRKDSNEPRTVRVLKEPGLYNILTKDYKFGTDSKKVTITSSSYSSSSITTSSAAVIHLIDDVLYFENEK